MSAMPDVEFSDTESPNGLPGADQNCIDFE